MDCVQDVADDDAPEHTADEVGELDHGDHVGEVLDVGAQAGGNNDQAHAAQQILTVQRGNFFLFILGAVLTVEMVALDQRFGHGATAQAGKYHAEGGAHDGQHRGVCGTQRLIGGRNGPRGAHTAH